MAGQFNNWGGFREGAGAKSKWRNDGGTKLIRIPIALEQQILEAARLIDAGIELAPVNSHHETVARMNVEMAGGVFSRHTDDTVDEATADSSPKLFPTYKGKANITLQLSPQTVEWLKQQENVNKAVEQLVANAEDSIKKELLETEAKRLRARLDQLSQDLSQFERKLDK